MKFALVLASILATISFAAQAQEDLTLETSDAQTSSMQQPISVAEESAVDSVWNFNLGRSQFERNDVAGVGTKGDGITLEVQRKIHDIFYVGLSYTNYQTQGMVYDPYYTTDVRTNRIGVDVMSASIEAHAIRLPVAKNSEVFAAVNGGIMGPISGNNYEDSMGLDGGMLYYGAGLGFNYNNQVGIRADLKSSRSYQAFNTISLVGYY